MQLTQMQLLLELLLLLLLLLLPLFSKPLGTSFFFPSYWYSAWPRHSGVLLILTMCSRRRMMFLPGDDVAKFNAVQRHIFIPQLAGEKNKTILF